MQRIYYWDGVVDPRNLAEDYKQTLHKLLNGAYRELDLEKLRGHDVYSIRINRSDRLLFTTIHINDKPHLMVLDVVLNHDYHKSSFLKPGVLRNYLELNGKLFDSKAITPDDFDKQDKLDISMPDKTDQATCEYVSAENFKGRFIEFNKDQCDITQRAKLPLLINGAAGSGKSCVALSLLMHYTAQQLDNLDMPILYVTESEKLCRSMQNSWWSLPIAQKIKSELVQFKSYRELVCENDQSALKCRIAGYDEFSSYIETIKNIRKKQDKTAQSISFENKDVLYQEMRIISGCGDYQLYEKLGERQSLIADKKQRKWLFTEYENYLKYLNQKNLIDFSFYRPTFSIKFKLVVVDESQDFSHLQLEVLRDIALARQICYCEDARQSLTDNLPKRTFFNRLLDAQHQQMTFRELSLTYRCPASVVSMANNVSKLGARLSGQRQPAPMQQEAQMREGEVEWLEDLSEACLLHLKEQANSPEFAVVTLPELKREACSRFGTQLVFTVDEIKGLEYQTVLVYRLLDTDVFYKANSTVCKIDEKGASGFTDEKYGPAFNAFYTACTRATQTLLIVQDNEKTKHTLRFITEKLRPQSQNKTEKQQVQGSKIGNAEQWFSEVKRQLTEGNIDIARSIYITKLLKTADEFEQFKCTMLGEQTLDVVSNKHAAAVNQRHGKEKNNKPTKAVTSATMAEPKRMIARDMIQYFSAGKLENPSFLFQKTPGCLECQFTYLFDDPKLRIMFMTEYLPKYFDQLAPYMTAEALCRHPESSHPLSPLYWICKDESTLYKLKPCKQFIPKLVEVLNSDVFIKTLNISADFVTTHPLYWLSCYDIGIVLLSKITRLISKFNNQFGKDLLLTKGPGLNGKPTSIFDNLYISNKGIEFLYMILSLNQGLINSLSIQDLFPRVAVHELPRIYYISNHQIGNDLIVLVRKCNPTVATIIHEQLMVSDMINLDEKINQITIHDQDIKTAYMVQLNPSKENIEAIFSHKKAHIYLFDVRLANNECLFTWLFDNMETRSFLLQAMLPKYAAKLTLFVRHQALCRVNHDNHSLAPPLLWLSGSEKCAEILKEWFVTNKRLIIGISPEAAFWHISCEQYIRANLPSDCSALNAVHKPQVSKDVVYSAFTLSLLSVSGMSVFAFLINAAQLSKFHDVVAELDRMPIIDAKTKMKISPVELMSRSSIGVIALREIVKNATVIQKKKLTVDLCEKPSTGNECPLVNILNYVDGALILTELLNCETVEPDEKLVKLLFDGFTSTVKADATALIVMSQIHIHAEIISVLTKYIAIRPGIISTFDNRIFNSETGASVDSDVRAKQSAAIKQLLSFSGGAYFVNFVNGIMKLRSQNGGYNPRVFTPNKTNSDDKQAEGLKKQWF